MRTATKTRNTTISVDVEYSGEAEVGIDEVRDWLDSASGEEIKSLGLSNPENIVIHCGEDAGSLYDLQRIQEICNGLHISDILARLAA